MSDPLAEDLDPPAGRRSSASALELESEPAPVPAELRDLLAAALAGANEAVWIFTGDFERTVFVNGAFTALTGYTAEELAGTTARLLRGPRTDPEVITRGRDELMAGRCVTAETFVYRKDGSEVRLEWRAAPLRDCAGRISHHVSCLRDVTARHQHTEAAEHASQAKTLFLSRISHELLTPLNSLIGFPEMLADGVFGPLNDRQRQAIDHVMEAGEQLRRLLQDLLDLARIEAGRAPLERSDFDLGALVADFAGPVAARARRKGVTLDSDIASDLPLLSGDPSRLKQVALNLLDNAVKYTPANGWVKLRLWGERSGAGQPLVRLSVADSGIGIRAEDRDRIFRMFEQVDPSLTRRHSGTGLGLALVTRILDLHGGRAWVESPGEGQGSTFHVELPGLPA